MSNSDTFMEVIDLLSSKNMSVKDIHRFFAVSHMTVVQGRMEGNPPLGCVLVERNTGELITISDSIDTVEMNQKIIESLQMNMLELSPTVSM